MDPPFVAPHPVLALDGGRAAHGTDAAFDADRERDRVLQARRLVHDRVTWRHLHRGGAGLEADLRLLLGLGVVRSRALR